MMQLIEDNVLTENRVLKKELHEIKERLKDKELVFDNILESTLAGYWDWYIQDGYEYMSPTFKSMFGYEDHELPNSPETWQKIIHPDDLPSVFDIFEKHVASKGRVPYNNEVRYFHKDGSIVWVYCNGKVIEWDDEGNPVRMVGSHVNITELKRVREMALYTKQLEVKNKELEQFTYVASHDLQEPLRTINSFTELLERQYSGRLDKKADKYLRFISQAASRMSLLVKGLLEYSLIGKNKDFVKVNLNEIICEVLEDLNRTINETKTSFEIGKLPTVKGYEMELRLLIQNLIANSIKFRKNGTTPKIKVSATKEKNYWTIAFQDNGIGIADEYKEKIFDIFKKLHNKNEYEGTGIGLAHCRKIVELHNGEIRVESDLNKGTTFYVKLPS